jgi:serine/threonine protein kinase
MTNMDKSFGEEPTIGPTSKSGGHAYALKAGDLFGQYRVIRVLGAGGMGEVYEVEHEVLRRRYAIKLLPETLDWKGVSIERFRREAQVMANLDHPNILKVDEFGEVNGRYWLRMEVAEGVDGVSVFGVQCSGKEKAVSLQNLAEAYGGKVPQEVLLPILRQILEGLQYAHAHGAIHRDLKPSNILLSSPNTDHRTPNTPLAKIADFGLVRLVGEDWVRSQAQISVQRSISINNQLTAGGTPSVASEGTSTRALLGTYEYMSPEQKRGEEADERSDLYAVGVMAYRLLTGRNIGPKLPSRIDKALIEGWDAFVEQALEEDPAERLANASAALTLLNAVGQGLESAVNKEEAKRKQEEEARQHAEQAQLEEQRRKQAAEEERKRRQKPLDPHPSRVPAKTGGGKGWLWLLLIAAGVGGYVLFSGDDQPISTTTVSESTAPPVVQPAPARPVAPATQPPSNNPLQVSREVVNQVLEAPFLARQSSPPIFVFAGMGNQTSQYVDTIGLNSWIRQTMFQSGKVRFVDAARQQELIREQGYQSATFEVLGRIGPQLGARYLLGGSLTEVDDRAPSHIQNGNATQKIYRLELRVWDLTDGRTVKSATQEFMHNEGRPIIGW